MKKKLLSILLTLAMVVTMMPAMSMSAFANESHEHDGVTFEAWTANDSLPSDAGNYYLTENVTLTQNAKITKMINICLNGKVIYLNGKAIILEAGESFGIYDCDKTTKHYFSEATEGNWVWNDALSGSDIKHTITGGLITNSETSSRYEGGAISISNTTTKPLLH